MAFVEVTLQFCQYHVDTMLDQQRVEIIQTIKNNNQKRKKNNN